MLMAYSRSIYRDDFHIIAESPRHVLILLNLNFISFKLSWIFIYLLLEEREKERGLHKKNYKIFFFYSLVLFIHLFSKLNYFMILRIHNAK